MAQIILVYYGTMTTYAIQRHYFSTLLKKRLKPKSVTLKTANHNRRVEEKLLHLNDGKIIALCLSNIGHIVLEFKAGPVVIDVLQDQVDSHVGTGGGCLSFHHKAEFRGLLKVQFFRSLDPYFT